MICRLSQSLLLLAGLSVLYRSAEAMPRPDANTWEEPHDAKWAEQVAHNRLFLTSEGRESLRHNVEVRNRKLPVEDLQNGNNNNDDNENQQTRQTNQIRGLRHDQRDLQLDPRGTPLNVLVCLVQWTNHPDRNTAVTAETYRQMFNGEGRDPDFYPGGTIGDYFKTMSYGDFEMNFEVTDWIMSEYDEQHFTADGTQGRTQELQEAFTPILDYLDDDFFNFRDFDSDFDRKIDITIFMHSGYDGTTRGVDCETGKTYQERIASHARTGADLSDWVSRAGFRLGGYIVVPAFHGVCDTNIIRIGTIAHELIHPFGMPEMYDTDFFDTGNLGGIDRFGVMANPSGASGGDLHWPGNVGAWTRQELGWTIPLEVTENGSYSLRPAELHPDMIKITKGFAEKEYLLIENRQSIPGGFDEKFFNPGGIVIYHVDESVWDLFEDVVVKGNHPRGGPFQAGWPGNGRHYPVSILQADGLYELEQGINGGQSADIWNNSSQVLGPGNGEKVANTANYPNTDSYAFGIIQTNGITIKNFQLQADSVMTFQICGLSAGDCPDVAAPITTPATDPPTKLPTQAPTKAAIEPPTTAPGTPQTPQNPGLPITLSPTPNPSNESSPLEELVNDSCEIAANALRPDGSKAISNIVNGTEYQSCYGENRTGVWYTIEAGTVPAGETIQANTCFPETDAINKISVNKGDNCNTLECAEADEIACKNGRRGHVVYWVAEPDEDYYLFVHSMEDSGESIDVNTLGYGSVLLDILNFPPVLNDDCGTAISAPTDGSVISSSTEGARPESNVTSSASCGIESAGVWFKVNGTGSDLRATTCLPGTDHPTQIHVFSGSCDSLSCISVEGDNYAVCSDFDVATNSATVNWESEEGAEYFILVGSRTGSVGNFELSVTEFTAAINDQCSNAIDLEVPENRTRVTGSTEDATNDFPYEEFCGAPLDTVGVWYTIEGTGDGLSFSTCGQNNYNSAISIFTGSECGELECYTGVATRDPSCDFNGVTAAWKSELNETYHVYVHGSARNSYGSFELEAEIFETTLDNGFCNEAIPLTDSGVLVQGSALEANHATPTNVCGDVTVNPGVWYTFEGTGNSLSLNACPSDFTYEQDVSVSVFSGENCGGLTCVSGNTFTQEFCSAPTNETSVESGRFLQNSTRAPDSLGFTSFDSELDVTYYLFVHGQEKSNSNITNVTSGIGDFNLTFFPGFPGPSPQVPTGPGSDQDSSNEGDDQQGDGQQRDDQQGGGGESNETDSDLSEKDGKSDSKKNLLWLLMLLLLIPPICILRNRTKVVNQSGRSSAKPRDSGIEEAPFSDERRSIASNSSNNIQYDSSASKRGSTSPSDGLLEESSMKDPPEKENWQTL